MAVTINGVDTNKFTVKQKEAKPFKFTFTVDLTGATFSLLIVDSADTTVISKADGDFDKTDIANKIVSVNVSDTDLDLPVGTYRMELKTTWNATNIDKTVTMKMKVTESLHP